MGDTGTWHGLWGWVCLVMPVPCLPLLLYCAWQPPRVARLGAAAAGVVGGVAAVVLLVVAHPDASGDPSAVTAAAVMCAFGGITGAHLGAAAFDLLRGSAGRAAGARGGGLIGVCVGVLSVLAIAAGWTARLGRLPLDWRHTTLYVLILLGTASLGALIGAPVGGRAEEA